MKQNDEIDRLLCRALRGEPAYWRAGADSSAGEFLERSRHHGVSALLFHATREREWWPSWPPEVRQALEQASRAGVAQDLLSTHYLRQLIRALAARDIPCLLLKGEAMAVSLYPNPGTRTRSDSDLFIRIGDISGVRELVLELGYRIVSPVYKSHQFTVMRPGDRTGNIRFDIHWRILNAPRYARALSFEEAFEASEEVPGLAPARMLNLGDALLLACMHRFGSERHDRDRLIWIHDIHALTRTMEDEQLLLFASRAVQRDAQQACLDGLLKSREYFKSEIPEKVVAILRTTSARHASLRRLADGHLGLFRDDWNQLRGRAAKTGLLKELFLPSGDYLLAKYKKQHHWWLPVLYLRRLLCGAFERLKSK